MQLHVVLAVGCAGAAGALLRLLFAVMLRTAGDAFPFGTLAVNVVGCFAFGVCWSLHEGAWSKPVAAAVFTGFLGAFTTFSTFAFECVDLWERGRWVACLFHAIGQNVLGIAAVAAGLWLGR
jgi:CrcB protein